MRLRLIDLDCPGCGSAMGGEPRDVLFLCEHCGAGAVLGEGSIVPTDSAAILPAAGRRAELWRPAWWLDVEVEVTSRRRADGATTPDWRGQRVFLIPAFDLALRPLVRLARALSTNPGDTGDVPLEPVRGGTLTVADALTVAEHLVIGDEVRKADMLASVAVAIEPTAHRLVAIPFEGDGRGMRCAVTGVSVPA